MPRYIPIPDDILFRNVLTGEPQMIVNAQTRESRARILSFREFFLDVAIHHPILATVKGGRALYKFEQAYDEAVKSDRVMMLDEDVWNTFKKIVTEPVYQVQTVNGPQTLEGFPGYHGANMMQLLPFIDAIEEAPVKKPAALKSIADEIA